VNRRAFTLIEVLMVLAILGALLAAMGTAMKGASENFADNTQIADAAQSARVVLGRITADMRMAGTLTWTAQKLTITPPAVVNGLTLVEYQVTGGVLNCDQTINGVVVHNALLGKNDNVVVDTFNIPTTIAGGPVTVQLGLHIGSNYFNVTSSTFPRRSMTY
jgi:prepilin-type N-terminal cleavage/methylation domain-containing protein